MPSRPKQVLRLVVAIAKHWPKPSRGFAQNVLGSSSHVNFLGDTIAISMVFETNCVP